MVFSSPIFIFVFLPLTWLLCRFIKNTRCVNAVLLVMSLVFYAFGDLRYLPLFVLSALVNYLAGRFLMRDTHGRRAILTVAVILNLAVLCFYKYTDFLISNLNTALGTGIPLTKVGLPIAISFFTFQGMSYVIDTYRNPEKGTKSFSKLLLFMAFFPQLVQGPILRFGEFEPQLEQRSITADNTAEGLRRFIPGLAKKVIIAGAAGKIADTVFNSTSGSVLDWRLAWLGGICYAVQIYYDFSGYSDMAFGLARMFGFNITENFNFPYGASSIREFWRKWHISLSNWFRDYLYIPLGGNRKGKLHTELNRMAVFLCTGIWHGANWTFLVWGVCHGILSDFENLGIIPVDKLSKSAAGRVVNRIYTLLSVMLLFVIFRADTLGQGWLIIKSMFSFSCTPTGLYELSSMLTASALLVLALGIILAGNAGRKLRCGFEEYSKRGSIPMAVCGLALLALMMLCVFAMSRGGFESFIYAKF